MTKQEFISWAESNGYKDNGRCSGRYIKNREDGSKICFKVSNIAVRYETQVTHPVTQYSPASKKWVRVRSNYFKHLSINQEGKLTGLKQ